jgi:hypothetical protein
MKLAPNRLSSDSLLQNSWNKPKCPRVQPPAFMHSMSASHKKLLFREYHRDLRLKQFQPGNDTSFEVRPLSLTPITSKIINIKDSNSPKNNDSK